jgi:hypothetical protein
MFSFFFKYVRFLLFYFESNQLVEHDSGIFQAMATHRFRRNCLNNFAEGGESLAKPARDTAKGDSDPFGVLC